MILIKNNMEIWCDIKGYEGMYQVSDQGRVKSVYRLIFVFGKATPHRERIMSLMTHYRGYLIVFLSKGNIKKKFFVHRLVADAFLENSTASPIVNHKYGNKLDNRASELEWATYKENTNHYYRNIVRAEASNEAF